MSSICSTSVLVDTIDIRHKGRQKLTPLEAQAAMYSPFAKGDGPASDDLKALKKAVAERNFADAVAAIGRLQRDSQNAGQAARAQAIAPSRQAQRINLPTA
jgi:hypothetical protein